MKVLFILKTLLIFFFFFLASPHMLWGLSSPTSDGIHTSLIGSTQSELLDYQEKSP